MDHLYFPGMVRRVFCKKIKVTGKKLNSGLTFAKAFDIL